MAVRIPDGKRRSRSHDSVRAGSQKFGDHAEVLQGGCVEKCRVRAHLLCLGEKH